MSTFLSLKSTPIVASTFSGKLPPQNRIARHVFPTFVSPSKMTLKMRCLVDFFEFQISFGMSSTALSDPSTSTQLARIDRVSVAVRLSHVFCSRPKSDTESIDASCSIGLEARVSLAVFRSSSSFSRAKRDKGSAESSPRVPDRLHRIVALSPSGFIPTGEIWMQPRPRLSGHKAEALTVIVDNVSDLRLCLFAQLSWDPLLTKHAMTGNTTHTDTHVNHCSEFKPLLKTRRWNRFSRYSKWFMFKSKRVNKNSGLMSKTERH